MVVAHFGDIFFATGHLPDFGPELFFFLLVKVARYPAIDTDVVVAHIGVGVFAQVGGYFDGFVIKKILITNAFTALVTLLLYFI